MKLAISCMCHCIRGVPRIIRAIGRRRGRLLVPRLRMRMNYLSNKCTEVQNPRRTRVSESLKAHALLKRTLITCNGKYTEDFRRLKRKKLAALHPVVFQVVFSLLLSLFRTLRRLCCRKSARNVAAVPS